VKGVSSRLSVRRGGPARAPLSDLLVPYFLWMSTFPLLSDRTPES